MSDSDTVISVESLSKRYLVGHEGPQERYHSLRDTVVRHGKNFLRKTVDMAKGKQIIQGDTVEEFWALKNVSFEVKRGEVLGIIGRNGAGKSTLLKILSRITEPTSGKVILQGRVASLLEVGTGFHPELSGRENIFLNGAILGMSRAEIKFKFDEIVDFAGVEKFLDTPVKRYSSGMYVRLAFAVAAHLEPEILIVDEVLAVGDSEFQKKCLGKMQDVAKSGRTVIFVSHNLGQVRSMCTQAVLLDSGRMAFQALPEVTLSHYAEVCRDSTTSGQFSGPLATQIEIVSIALVGTKAGPRLCCRNDKPMIDFEIRLLQPIGQLRITIALFLDGVRVCTAHEGQDLAFRPAEARELKGSCNLPVEFLKPGDYTLGFGICDGHPSTYAWNPDAISFSVLEETTIKGLETEPGLVVLPMRLNRTSTTLPS
jgi:ABC-type polysaccharide/polyol phosphate transport system ATPase subunit